MKKNVIIASSSFEISSDSVMEWIDYLGGNPIRINSLDDFFGGEFSMSPEKKNEPVSIWFRRTDMQGGLSSVSKEHIHPSQNDKEGNANDLILKMKRDLRHGDASLAYNYWKSFNVKKSIGTLSNSSPDKLGQLRIAIELGIDTPATVITNSRKELLKFFEKHEKGIVSKSINDGFMVTHDKIPYSMFTEEITLNMIKALPDQFCRTLFQEKLDKDYEIRSFFLKGKFYSMAIFSQKDQKTAVDFRKYNTEKPNRISRCRLPKEVEKGTKKMMKRLKLDTGSIDFVKTKDGRWVYLEVNPVGQFGMVSGPCNYQLEKKVASKLV